MLRERTASDWMICHSSPPGHATRGLYFGLVTQRRILLDAGLKMMHEEVGLPCLVQRRIVMLVCVAETVTVG